MYFTTMRSVSFRHNQVRLYSTAFFHLAMLASQSNTSSSGCTAIKKIVIFLFLSTVSLSLPNNMDDAQ